MKKKFTAILLTLTLLLVTGCGVIEVTEIDEDGSTVAYSYTYLTESEKEEACADGAMDDPTVTYIGTEVIDDKTYYVYKSEETHDKYDGIVVGVTINPKEYIHEFTPIELNKYDFYAQRIVFPYEVLYTNGTLSPDGKTVEFDAGTLNSQGIYYAYCKGAEHAIKITNAYEHTVYHQSSDSDEAEPVTKYYTKSSTLKISCPEKVKSVTINHKNVKVNKNSVSLKGMKDGEYDVVIKTKNFTSKFTVVKDTKKPSISGVKNGGVYNDVVNIKVKDNVETTFYDIVVDGEERSFPNITISEVGEHTITVKDKAGNVRTVKFTIE